MKKHSLNKRTVSKLSKELGRPRKSNTTPVASALANNPSAPNPGESPVEAMAPQPMGTYNAANFKSDSSLHIPSGAGRVRGGKQVGYRPNNRVHLVDDARAAAYCAKAFPKTSQATGDLMESVPKTVMNRSHGVAEAARQQANQTRNSRTALGIKKASETIVE